MLLHIWFLWSLTVPDKSPYGLQRVSNQGIDAVASLVVVINLFLNFTPLLTTRYLLSVISFPLLHRSHNHYSTSSGQDSGHSAEASRCIVASLLPVSHILSASAAQPLTNLAVLQEIWTTCQQVTWRKVSYPPVIKSVFHLKDKNMYNRNIFSDLFLTWFIIEVFLCCLFIWWVLQLLLLLCEIFPTITSKLFWNLVIWVTQFNMF